MKAALLAGMHSRRAVSYQAAVTKIIAFAYLRLAQASGRLVTLRGMSRTCPHTGKSNQQEQYFQVHEVLSSLGKPVKLVDCLV